MLILIGLPYELSDACRRKMKSFWNIPKPINLKMLTCFYSQILGAIWQLSTGLSSKLPVGLDIGIRASFAEIRLFSPCDSLQRHPHWLCIHGYEFAVRLSLSLWSISVLFLCFEYKLSCSSGAGFSQLFSHWLPLLPYACRCTAQASTCWDFG